MTSEPKDADHDVEDEPAAARASTGSPDQTRIARQAIRAEAAARAYAERQLTYAQRDLEQARSKLAREQAARQESKRSAQEMLALKEAAERGMATARHTAAQERADRMRAERALAEAQAKVAELQSRLETALGRLEVERQARERAEEALAQEHNARPSKSVTEGGTGLRPKFDKTTAPGRAGRGNVAPRFRPSEPVKWWRD